MKMMLRDIVKARVVHSPDDGGYYGEIYLSRPGQPGREDQTEKVYPTAEEARRVTEELCRKLYPDTKPDWRD
jgi:hypothetical protein